MGVQIKICGLMREADIRYVNRLRPEYAGFVFAPGSRRYVSDEEAGYLSSLLEPGIVPVGVFVNEDPERVADLLNRGSIRMAQLHGQEDAAYIRRLRRLTDKPLIQAFSIRTKEDVRRALESEADYLLFDQGSGGTGLTFDWSLILEVTRPFFLAGGLGEGNLEKAVLKVRPWAVDLSSSLETDGRKDPEKIRRAAELVRRLNQGEAARGGAGTEAEP